MIKIGLIGGTRVGKDTIGQMFIDKGFARLAYADALKAELHSKYPNLPREPKPVRAYQLYGQLQREAISETYWIDKVMTQVEAIEKSNHFNGIVITDVRQLNEVKSLYDDGFILVKVKAPEKERIKRMEKSDKMDKRIFNFETEKQLNLPEVDKYVSFTITNDQSLEHLQRDVDMMYSMITSTLYEETQTNNNN